MSAGPVLHALDPLRNISVFRETCIICGHEVREAATEDCSRATIECSECGTILSAPNRVRWN